MAMVLLWCYFHRRIREASQRIRDIHSRQMELAPIVTAAANAGLLPANPCQQDQNYSTLFGAGKFHLFHSVTWTLWPTSICEKYALHLIFYCVKWIMLCNMQLNVIYRDFQIQFRPNCPATAK